jgi:chromate transporter
MVLGNGWLTEERLTYMIAVGESTPGPIMVNLASYIGYHQGGVLGSAIATFAVILPAYLVILLVLGILKNTIQNPYVQAVLRGLKPCVTGIVLATGIYMVLQNCLLPDFDLRSMVVTGILGAILITYRLIFKKKLSPLVLIGISACLGIIVFSFG